MPEDINDAQLDGFNTKLQEFRETLTDPQKHFLDALLTAALRMIRTQDELDAEFEHSFTPQEALAHLLPYVSTPPAGGITFALPGTIKPFSLTTIKP